MELWKQWLPKTEISPYLTPVSTHDNGEIVQFLFKNEYEKIITFVFTGYNILSYRETEEGNFLKTPDNENIHNEISRSHGWPLFTVEHSHYIHWLQQQSFHMHDVSKITHYVFYTWDVVIEVVSLSSPDIIL